MLGPRPLLRHAFFAGLALTACRGAPTEAPAPDASAAFEPDVALGPALVSPDATDDEGAIPTAAARARPPGSIFRDEVERATGPGPAYLLRQLGPEPYRHEGHFVGWEITQLFPDDPTLCSPCDLAVGDVILGVNGSRLQTPQALSDAMLSVPKWTELAVQSLRNGRRRSVTYTIIDDAG
ncbi:MAG: hypothetical protein K0V04_08465 [Deltaproteobacteria bacterium]|nr:hypothetical protein [Deltaproteobacteria bacterium]